MVSAERDQIEWNHPHSDEIPAKAGIQYAAAFKVRQSANFAFVNSGAPPSREFRKRRPPKLIRLER
jgi:hypothetical protein